MQIVLLIIFGIIGGILGGMGMGGGTLLIPLLTLILNIQQQVAQGINLLAFLPMSIIALIIHSKNKLVKYKIGLPIIIAGVLSSIGGAFLATKINSGSLSIYFGIFLIILGILQLYSLWLFKDTKKESLKQNNQGKIEKTTEEKDNI